MTTATKRHLAGDQVARTMADLFEAEDPSCRSLADVRARLVERASQVAVPYSDAANLLQVSVPTVRAWAARGVLTEAAGLSVHAVTASSLGRVLAILERLDESAPRRGMLMLLAEEIRNQQLRELAHRVSSSSATGRKFAEVTDEELAAL